MRRAGHGASSQGELKAERASGGNRLPSNQAHRNGRTIEFAKITQITDLCRPAHGAREARKRNADTCKRPSHVT